MGVLELFELDALNVILLVLFFRDPEVISYRLWTIYRQ